MLSANLRDHERIHTGECNICLFEIFIAVSRSLVKVCSLTFIVWITARQHFTRALRYYSHAKLGLYTDPNNMCPHFIRLEPFPNTNTFHC